eukprot:215060_1
MSKEWSNGLFECFGDCGACVYASCCPACAGGEIWEQGQLGTGEWAWWVGCCLFCVLGDHCCGPCFYAVLFTGNLREKRGIEGGFCGDCLECCFCGCCTHTRNLREVRGT